MAVEITLNEAEKNYVELLLAALKTNERFASTKIMLVNFTKKELGERGSTLYKQAFDPTYDKKLVEKPIVLPQLKLIGKLLKDCTADNIGKVTEGYLAKKYGGSIEEGWKRDEWHGQLKRYPNTLHRFLFAFVALLQERVNKNKDYFTELVVSFK